jgi:hypothetical protein
MIPFILGQTSSDNAELVDHDTVDYAQYKLVLASYIDWKYRWTGLRQGRL